MKRREILVDDVVVVGEGIGRDEVASADLGAVEPKLARGDVQQPLDDEHPVLTSGTAIGRDDRERSEDRSEPAVIGGHDVGAKQGALAVERHCQAVRIVGAAVVQELVPDPEDVAVTGYGDLRVVDFASAPAWWRGNVRRGPRSI